MIRLNTEVFVPMVLNAGGTVYPPHAPVLTAAQWQQHYGPELRAKFRGGKAELRSKRYPDPRRWHFLDPMNFNNGMILKVPGLLRAREQA